MKSQSVLVKCSFTNLFCIWDSSIFPFDPKCIYWVTFTIGTNYFIRYFSFSSGISLSIMLTTTKPGHKCYRLWHLCWVLWQISMIFLFFTEDKYEYILFIIIHSDPAILQLWIIKVVHCCAVCLKSIMWTQSLTGICVIK